MFEDHVFIPMFVRVVGLNKNYDAKKPYLDLTDPAAIPACMTAYCLDGFAVFGWYFSDLDSFCWSDAEGNKIASLKGDLYHTAAIATITNFHDTLEEGGSDPNVEFPPNTRYAKNRGS